MGYVITCHGVTERNAGSDMHGGVQFSLRFCY